MMHRPPDDSTFLYDLSLAAARTRSAEEALTNACAWVRRAIGEELAGFHVSFPDTAGRLRVDVSVGTAPETRRSARKRTAFTSRRTMIAGSGQAGVLYMPLSSPDATLGVIEIVAPRAALEDRLPLLEVVAAQTALAYGHARLQEEWTEALANEKRRLEGLDKGLVWAAHELRAPVVAAERAVEAVLDTGEAGEHRPEDDRDVLRLVQQELRRAADTATDLLRWAVGDSTLRRRPTDLGDLLLHVADTCSIEGARDRIEVRTSHGVTASVDRALLSVAISNLVRNGLAYGGAGHVLMSLDRADASATITVRDEGPGIAPGDREVIFDPFVRRSSVPGAGHGIGLFLARRVIQAHGGEIRLDAGPEGATFRVDLPLGA
jgi:signal transduction histidine kinase